MVILCRSPKGLYANYNMITFDLFTSENPQNKTFIPSLCLLHFFFQVTCFMRDCDVGQNNPQDWINENKNVNHESHFQISVVITI